MATCATCESQRLQILCKKARSLYPDAKITLQPCVELAAKIEKGDFLNIDLSKFLPKGNPTAVVLGCTHYIYVKEQIENFYGCKAYDGNVGIAKRLQKIIRLKNEQKMEKFNGKNHFCKKRDERPPNEKNREKRPFLPPLSNTKNEKEKANECSLKKGDEIAKRGNFAVFYLGNRQKTNMRSFNLFLKNRKK